MTLDDLQRRVGAWGARTFPRSTDASKLAHLQKELIELVDAAAGREAGLLPVDAVAEEAADLVLILCHLAHAHDFSLGDAIERKFAEVQLRRWLVPDVDGVMEHDRSNGPSGGR